MRQEDTQSDWNAFVESVPWFARGKARTAKLARLPNRVLATDAAELFPKLNLLLQRASVAEVALGRECYELFGWTNARGERLGWLCMPPADMPSPGLHESHCALLRCFGGIVERFNEPEDTWLLNLNEALTERVATSADPDAYAAVFDGPLPINAESYYPIAIEANGNTTLCHRESGQVLLFAPDHSFDHVTVLQGCPDYTLYTVNGAGNLRDWVETIAQQWLQHVAHAE
jgi:hypothetical protein